MLPQWVMALRFVLFPLDSLYWHLSKSRGYQPESDTWLIEGIRCSGKAMRMLSKAQGEAYRITRAGETLTLELIQADTAAGME